MASGYPVGVARSVEPGTSPPRVVVGGLDPNVKPEEVGARLERSRGALRPLVVVEGGLGGRRPLSRELESGPRSLVVQENPLAEGRKRP